MSCSEAGQGRCMSYPGEKGEAWAWHQDGRVKPGGTFSTGLSCAAETKQDKNTKISPRCLSAAAAE